MIFLIALAPVFYVNGQMQQHTYRFYETLKVEAPECGPDLTPSKALDRCTIGSQGGTFTQDNPPCGVRRKVYRINKDWGITYPNTDNYIGESYTIQMYIKIPVWESSRTRLIDFSNGASDDGIYFERQPGNQTACLQVAPLGNVGPCPYFTNTTYYLLTITRNGATNTLDIYANQQLLISYNDNDGRYVGKANLPIHLFKDDDVKSCESSEVNIAYLSFSAAYSSKQEVQETSDKACRIANINAYPEFQVNPDLSCGLKSVKITYTGSIAAPGQGYQFDWNWDGGKVISGTGMGPFEVAWDSPGVKKIVLKVVNEKCSREIENLKEITISSLNLNTTITHPTCREKEGTIAVTSIDGKGPFEYSLDSVHFQKEPVFKVAPASYRVYIKDAENCMAAKNATIFEVESMVLQTISDTAICAGNSVPLTTTTNGTKWAWTPSEGLSNSNDLSPVATPTSTTEYTITASKPDCEVAKKVRITVVPPFDVVVSPDLETNSEVPIQLSGYSPQMDEHSGVKYQWLPAIGLNNPNITNPIATLTVSQTYTFRVTSPEGCSAEKKVSVKVVPTSWIYLPNAFSPNNDGHNDVLYLISKGLQSFSFLKIYNRWGELVFFTDQADKGWDGFYKNKEAIAGTYTYLFKAVSDKGKTIEKNGSLTLFR